MTSTTPDSAPSMSDEQLGEALVPDGPPELRAQIVSALSPERRRSYEQLLFVADELNAGRAVDGVMVDSDR